MAIRGADGPWFLANASPDVRPQVETLRTGHEAIRASLVGGILLTDAEIDHTAGLLLLRESSNPLPVYATRAVRDALTEGFPLARILERYCGLEWHEIEPGRPYALPGSSLELEIVETGGDPPLYLQPTDATVAANAVTFRDRTSGGVVTYAPGIARLDAPLRERLAASDAVLVDGTFWTGDELATLGISRRTAADMGHVPLSGPGGMIEELSAFERPRKILVHVNNTNPILVDGSPEREALSGQGIELAYDGLVIDL